jgi:hypothetical protein
MSQIGFVSSLIPVMDFNMNEEDYKDLLQRAEESQRILIPYTDKKDGFAEIAKRLVALLEKAKKRMIRKHGGQ